MKFLSKLSVITLAFLFAFTLLIVPPVVSSVNGGIFSSGSAMAAEEQRAPPPSRSTQQLSRRVYQRIEEIIEFRDLEQFVEAIAVLDEIKELDDDGRLNDREQYMMWVFYASIAQEQEDYVEATESYRRILDLENMRPEDIEATLKTLGQLSFALEDFEGAIGYYLRLIDVAFEPQSDAFLRISQAHYTLEQYNDALPYLVTHIEMEREALEDISESTYNLLVGMYYSVDDLTSARQTLREKIMLFNVERDWTFLAGVNAELDSLEEQAYLFYLANLQNILDSESELMTLAALFYNYENPYAGALVVQQGIDSGIIEEDSDNLAFLALAYQFSREDALAVAPLTRAAEMSDDGQLYIRLGNVYSNLYDFENAADAYGLALDKGGLDREDEVYLYQARAYYELNRFTEGVAAARSAGEDERSEESSANWIRILNNAKRTYDTSTARRIELEGYFR